MPLLVTDYSWTQTESTVYIHVPLKGAKAATVDIVSTDEYLKVHYPPYLFEAFLVEPVHDDRSSAKIGNGVAVITLPKRTNRIWEHLMIPTDDKENKKEIRKRALLKYQEKLSSESKSKGEKQRTEKKYALETMMKLEKEERDSIQKMKDAERKRITAELDAWQLRRRQKAEEEQVKLHSQRENQNKPQAKTEKQERSDTIEVKLDRKTSEREFKKKKPDLPAPRTSGNIQVTFTPRVFPTALRESRVQEEEEWLYKQAEARRAVNANLLFKLFFLIAVNAYNLAIQLNRKMPALYSNRAACHLKLRNLHKAIEDSSQALDLLTPPVAANQAARARAHVRRGSAFCQLQLYAEGLQDFQAALKIDCHNEALQADTQKIRDIIQGTARAKSSSENSMYQS
uniref:Dynein axonemal assembly factor 4 n=1 Tax=Echeneis naucrates TaxID=173247 RepID=A0A665WG82_ECHNA